MTWEMPTPRNAPAPSGAECANCKMPIERDAVEKAGRTFCCEGCAYGGPCIC